MTWIHRRPPSTLASALLLMAALLPGCLAGADEPDPGNVGITPGRWSTSDTPAPRLVQTLGDPSSSGLSGWASHFDNVPTVYDINGDGVDEIIAHGKDTNVYVFDATTGQVLAKVPTKYPPAWHIERVLNGVRAEVLSPGAPPSLIITNHAAYVASWTFDPLASTSDRFVFHKDWERRLDACHRSPGMDAAAAVADLDNDGILEIVVQTEEIGFYALNRDGTIRWKQCWSGGNSAPVIDDLDGDGRLEVIIASDSGRIAVLDGDLGRPLWTFNAGDPAYGIIPASVPVSPTVAELDGASPKEILFTARNAPSEDPASFAGSHMAIFAIHQNLTTYQAELLWVRQPAWANPMSNTKLVVGDVDGDGRVDIFGMDWNTIGHRPGAWERLGPAHVFRLDETGSDVWVREIDAWWSNQDILVADADGDGKADVLVNGPGEGGDGLWHLASATGGAEGFLGVAPWKMLRGATLVDLRHDGALQMLVPVTPMEPASDRGAILVFEMENASRSFS